MLPDPQVMQAVEKLGYRVTVADVASQAGLDLNVAERGVLALASEANGHLQVSDTGEIAYVFPRNFRSVLRSKSAQLRRREFWAKVWKIIFYIIRISFGIFLVGSIGLLAVALIVIFVALSASQDGDDRDSGGGVVFMPNFWFGPDFFWVFTPDYYDDRRVARRQPDRQMNFLEAVFSFLFGDGNPNANLEEQRWQTIATVIRNHRGAVAAEQIAPYLDDLGDSYSQEYGDYMLPVLTRFNGRPEVSPTGQIVYHFPELQVMAQRRQPVPVPAFLREARWKFSEAGSGQIMLAASLGVVNIILALVVGAFFTDPAIASQLGGIVEFVYVIFPLLLGYGVGFLAVPLIRYFWLQGRNAKVENRNHQRQQRSIALEQPTPDLQQKLTYARQFAAETIVSADSLAYTTETDLTEQELAQSDKIDAEWRRRLESGF
ncbi:hypothetical protein H6F67_17240 [Microcoleus sp. FACHB-1515]|uniref:hypothetical protein n=1 Tax=Cyanophyceae TaxID=3028117 RepID=UPI0016872185|nr:hypothetical protein [Microcoleus sp. FACHB-1515]MBD2091591.1 hypothetical protein [Microcoleus sp. FACHB-1515]